MEKTILLSHGGGGEESGKLINEVIFKAFDSDILREANDSALLSLESKDLAFTTDSYVVTPLFFSGGNIGKIAVCGTINDLAMVGASAKYISCAFIIEEGFLMSEFKEILNSMKETADKAGVKIVCGDTKVVPKGKCDKIFINTSGIGEVVHKTETKNLEVGAKILLSGDIARHGSVIMAARDEISFESELESDAKSLKEVVLELFENGIKPLAMRDATRGGISGVLNEWAKLNDLEIKVKESEIRVTEPVRGICEILGFEPYDLANEGTFVLAVREEEWKKALEILKKHDKNANLIGEITGQGAKVILETLYGVERFLEEPKGELLPRIC